MATKTYVLLDHLKPTAPVYLRLNGNQRQRLDKRPVDHAYLKYTIVDPEDGKNKTFRLKLSCDSIDQAVQIKEHSIPANERFTQRERDSVRFRYGTLTTSNPTVQRFLEKSPQFNGFKGERPDDIPRPMYDLLDKNQEVLTDNQMFKKRVRAGVKIAQIDTLSEAQSLMIRLNGSAFKTPDNLEECQNALAQYLDDADDEMLDNLLRDEINLDEEVSILVGKAIKHKTLSFDDVKDQVVRITPDGRKLKVKEISSDYDFEVRQQYFVEFLTSPQGRLLLGDIQADVDRVEGVRVDEKEVEKEVEKEENIERPNSSVSNARKDADIDEAEGDDVIEELIGTDEEDKTVDEEPEEEKIPEVKSSGNKKSAGLKKGRGK